MDNNYGDGFGSGIWLLVILFFLIGFGGNGFGYRGGDYGQFATAASQQDILFGQKFSDIDNKIDRLGYGIADSTFALNNAILGEGRNVQMQIAETSCANQRNTDALRYDISQMNAATNAAIHAEGEQTRAMIQQNKIEALQGEVNELKMAQMMCGVPKINPYMYGVMPYATCGGCGCGCNHNI